MLGDGVLYLFVLISKRVVSIISSFFFNCRRTLLNTLATLLAIGIVRSHGSVKSVIDYGQTSLVVGKMTIYLRIVRPCLIDSAYVNLNRSRGYD